MSALIRWVREVVSGLRASTDDLTKRNSPVRRHAPGLFLWVTRLIVEYLIRRWW